MAESYVTLGEAAELEGIGYETMKKRYSVTRSNIAQGRKSVRTVEKM